MCSKKWAKPDLPGSTSLRDPVWTGICSDTMFGKPVGTTMTLRPFGRVLSTASNGRIRLGAAGAGWAWAFMASRLVARDKAMGSRLVCMEQGS